MTESEVLIHSLPFMHSAICLEQRSWMLCLSTNSEATLSKREADGVSIGYESNSTKHK